MKNLLKYLNPYWYYRMMCYREARYEVYRKKNDTDTGASISQMKTFERCSDKVNKALLGEFDNMPKVREVST